MNNEEISKLVRKFYDGVSTDEEEKYLRALFSGEQTPEGFETEKEFILFCMSRGHVEGPSPGFEEKILKRVDDSHIKSFETKSGKYLLPLISSVAAAIILMIGTYFFLENRSGYKDTFSDPEIAYNETMRILMDVSVRLNKGTNALEPVSKLSTMTDFSLQKISESSALINKSLSKLNKIGKATEDKIIGNTSIINK
jgi:hypothetical protein